MKKLSLQRNDFSNDYFIIGKPIAFIKYEEGRSCFVTTLGNEIIGACCKCKNHFCASYSEQELKSKLFLQFPKNPSSRVCPTDALRFKENGEAYITDNCIMCGLCVYRCPFAAIQYNPSHNSCYVNNEISNEYISCSEEEQDFYINQARIIPLHIKYRPITISFSERYAIKLKTSVARFPDISEIIVRNTFLNLGVKCNVNAKGNNHIRIEFFADINGNAVIGESEITNTDTLSVNRRILDDVAVLKSRYHFDLNNIIPLSVLNGLPNKRTDYYEVIKDVKNALGIQIYTLTYHILYMLHLYQVRLSKDILCGFVIDNEKMSLIEPTKKAIDELISKDDNLATINYNPTK